MSDASKELVHRWFEEGFNERNTDLFAELASPDYVEHATEPFRTEEHLPPHVRDFLLLRNGHSRSTTCRVDRRSTRVYVVFRPERQRDSGPEVSRGTSFSPVPLHPIDALGQRRAQGDTHGDQVECTT